MSTRSFPIAATALPNRSSLNGVGLVKVVSNVPLVLNRYAAPALGAPVLSLFAPMSTRSLPTAATALPKLSKFSGVGLTMVSANQFVTVATLVAVTAPLASAVVVTAPAAS